MSLQVPFPHGGGGPIQGSKEPGVPAFTSFSFFARTISAALLSAGMDGWMEDIKASSSLTVNLVAQLLEMRAYRESGSQKSYQKHSSTFIRLFPLSKAT